MILSLKRFDIRVVASLSSPLSNIVEFMTDKNLTLYCFLNLSVDTSSDFSISGVELFDSS